MGLLSVTYIVIYALSSFRLSRKYAVTHETVALPDGSAGLERGRHLVKAVAHCGNCHGPDFGGKVMIDNVPLGRLVAPNLTAGAGGIGGSYRVEDWVRAIRHGLDRQGHPLKVMPSETFQELSQEDLGAIIAYVRQAAPVDRSLEGSRIGPLTRVLFVFGALPLLPAEHIDHLASARFAPPAGETAEYGRYLATTAGCVGCHGKDLGGTRSPAPGFPDRPRIARLGDRGWTEADFVRALREGQRPDGTTLSNEMPWRALGHMTDEELRAVWLFLNDQPAGPQRSAMR